LELNDVQVLAGPPCGIMFGVHGLGNAVVPFWPPNVAQVTAAWDGAYDDSERKAQALCALNPDCMFAAYVGYLPANPAQGTGFRRVRLGPVNLLVCRYIFVWICVTMPVVNVRPAPPELRPGDIT